MNPNFLHTCCIPAGDGIPPALEAANMAARGFVPTPDPISFPFNPPSPTPPGDPPRDPLPPRNMSSNAPLDMPSRNISPFSKPMLCISLLSGDTIYKKKYVE